MSDVKTKTLQSDATLLSDLGTGQLTTMSPANKALAYLDKAVSGVAKLGITQPAGEMPVQTLIAQVSEFGSDEAMSVSLVLARQGMFNDAVRQEITGMDIANRYELITTSFSSIRQDTSKQLQYMENGKIGFMEKISMKVRDMRKGTIPARFAKIKTVYLDVSSALSDQLAREGRVLEAYADFRFAMKDAESQAHKILETATVHHAQAKRDVEMKQLDLDTKVGAGVSDQERSRLELSRDESVRDFQKMDERFQIAKDLADQLRVAYHASEFVFARLAQTSQVKKRLYDQAVMFFATNEIVFTGQAAAFNSTQGLREGTKTLNAMKDGMNQGLEELAKLGGSQLEAGLRAGYGPGLKAESVKLLVDAVVDFQDSSMKLIQELRNEATENASEVARIAEDGKQRFAALISRSSAA